MKIEGIGATPEAPRTGSPEAAPVRGRSGGRQHRIRTIGARVPESAALIVVLGALVLFFALKSPYFFNTANFTNILIASVVLGVVASPGTMLLIAGQFDLSVGGVTALVTTVFAETFAHHHSVVLAILAGLGVGLGVGILNGFLITVVGINPLITTIGTMEIARNFAYIQTGGVAVGFNGFTTLGLTRPFLNIPWMAWIFLMVAVITAVVMRATTYGLWLYAIGGNSGAARLAGIRPKRVIFVTFCLSGLACGLAGLLLASQTGQGSGDTAMSLEFSVITAVVLGGCSLTGGRGSMFGTLLAVLVIGVVDNGIILLGINSFWQGVVTGLLLIIAVAIDQLRLRVAVT